MFSSMKFLQNLLRNRLGEQHLTDCARLFSDPLDLQAEGLMPRAAQHRGTCP